MRSLKARERWIYALLAKSDADTCPWSQAAKTYINNLGDSPRLTDKEARELATSGSPADMQRLMLGFVPAAIKLAKAFRGLGVADEDLISIAMLGLCTGIKKWNPQHVTSASALTFVSFWIALELRQAIRSRTIIRVPKNNKNGKKIKIISLIKSTGETVELPAARDALVHIDTRDLVDRLSAPLTQREKYVLSGVFGPCFSRGNAMPMNKERKRGGFRYRSRRVIADALAISVEWVRRIELQALATLKARAAELRESFFMI
jgi:RNA polymerase sigma factor (sigma-70 family)